MREVEGVVALDMGTEGAWAGRVDKLVWAILGEVGIP
jgi:hypothetical protein